MTLTQIPLSELADLLRKRQITPCELVEGCLERIRSRNDQLNAFVTVADESAREEARRAEAEIASGDYRGPLHGIPIAIKDLVDVAGLLTTAGSRVFAGRVAAHDAPVVQRLRAGGAVIIGKTNLHEAAYGGSGVITASGPVRNPHDPARIAGGSSSGSAVAVATGMCVAALGTDTAGSIRLPAAFCGVVGLKPAYGLVNLEGVIPLAVSYDHLGPMTRTAADAAIVLDAMADTNLAATFANDLTTARVGVAREYFFDDLDAEVATAVEVAITRFGSLSGREVREVRIPVDADRTVHQYEAWQFHREHVQRNGGLYHPETLRRIRTGERITFEQYESKRRELEHLRRSAHELFRDCDIVLTPTAPVLPPPVSELLDSMETLRARELVMLRNTRPFNVLGVPAISVPCGQSRKGLPIGLQIAGPSEAMVLGAASAFERASA